MPKAGAGKEKSQERKPREGKGGEGKSRNRGCSRLTGAVAHDQNQLLTTLGNRGCTSEDSSNTCLKSQHSRERDPCPSLNAGQGRERERQKKATVGEAGWAARALRTSLLGTGPGLLSGHHVSCTKSRP